MRKDSQFLYDILYKKIPYTNDEVRLFQTKELARLRHVSLSAVPPWTIKTSFCATKFEHSVGVAHLAKIVGTKKEFKDIASNLYFAALAHDIATPPFSHTSETYQHAIFKKNHEEMAGDILIDSEFAKVVKKQGGDMGIVIKLILGELKPFSDVLNGSIDIDNLDNSPRYSLSLGVINHLPYAPEKLVLAFGIKNNQLYLAASAKSQIIKWDTCRKITYRFVFSDTNLAPAAMVFRALYFAFKTEKIKKDYFTLTDEQAFEYLSNKCGKEASQLTDLANRWVVYEKMYEDLAYSSKSKKIDNNDRLFINNDGNRIADEIARQLHVRPHEVAIHMGANKAYKQIHIPLLGDSGEKQKHESKNKDYRMIQIFIHPKYQDSKKKFNNIIRAYFKGS